MAETTEERMSPPYCSWGTLSNMFDRMEKEGVPARIDKSYMRGMAGGAQAQVKHALRSMGLIEDNGVPTTTLHDIATQSEQRPEIIAKILRERYAPLVNLPPNATRGQLDETLSEVYDLRGDTARKAVTFYVAATTYAGIPISNEIKPKPGRPSSVGGSTARRKPPRKKPAGTAETTPPAPTTPTAAHSRSLDLASGGTVTVSYSVDLFDLSDKDREFVLGLIDSLRNYKGGKPPAAKSRQAKPENPVTPAAEPPEAEEDATDE